MITVKCFAVVKELIGQGELSVDLVSLENATLLSLWNYLEKTYPQLDGKQKYLRFSKNMSFVSIDSDLADGDEIGIIPPVAGG